MGGVRDEVNKECLEGLKAQTTDFAVGVDSDKALGLMELKRDPLYRRIPEERLSEYVERSLEFGRSAAAEKQGRSIREWLEQDGIAVETVGSSGSLFGTVLRAQIDWTGKVPKITVYRESMNQLAEASAAWPQAFGKLSAEAAEDIHLAHEYYHWLEYRSGLFTGERLAPVETFRWGPLRRKVSIRQSGEIAAHAFAQSLLELRHLPNLLDYLYLLHKGELDQSAFEKEMEKCREALGAGRRHMV
ncbi:hypothetical protein [Saccharibacillus deserti]|uniref:hypothetical protein n=1 Tax=Saccharibacillus deserti TaxID=1634444 RepID=UPI001551B7F2|nr:hypothetical protein [Saccharibacillus deserti]